MRTIKRAKPRCSKVSGDTLSRVGPEPSPKYCPGDERRQARNLSEAGYDVSGGINDACKDGNSQAGSHGTLDMQAEPQNHQRDQQHRAPYAHKTDHSSDAHPGEEHAGAWDPARTFRGWRMGVRYGIGENNEKSGENELYEDFRGETVDSYPNQ